MVSKKKESLNIVRDGEQQIKALVGLIRDEEGKEDIDWDVINTYMRDIKYLSYSVRALKKFLAL